MIFFFKALEETSKSVPEELDKNEEAVEIDGSVLILEETEKEVIEEQAKAFEGIVEEVKNKNNRSIINQEVRCQQYGFKSGQT